MLLPAGPGFLTTTRWHVPERGKQTLDHEPEVSVSWNCSKQNFTIKSKHSCHRASLVIHLALWGLTARAVRFTALCSLQCVQLLIKLITQNLVLKNGWSTVPLICDRLAHLFLSISWSLIWILSSSHKALCTIWQGNQFVTTLVLFSLPQTTSAKPEASSSFIMADAWNHPSWLQHSSTYYVHF